MYSTCRMFQGMFQGMLVLVAVGFLASCGGGNGGGNGGDAPSTPEVKSPGTSETTPEVKGVPASADAPATATIKGKVSFAGTPPKLPPLNFSADAKCLAMHTGEKVAIEAYVVGAKGELKNVIVSISAGLPAGMKHPVPTEKVVFDQRSCIYTPHVFAVQAGQDIEVLNSDDLLHNVHFFPKRNTEVNKAMPTKGMTILVKFRKAESPPVRIKCEVHPWMTAFVGVFDHPYYAVSAADGTFELPKLPPGTYTVTAWHEKVAEQTLQVTVGDGETKEVAFELKK